MELLQAMRTTPATREFTDDPLPDDVLYDILDQQLKGRDFVCGDYSIADMMIWPWVVPWRNQGQIMDEYPNLDAWRQRVIERPAVQKGFSAGAELRRVGLQAANEKEAQEARKVLFGQRGRH